MGACPRIPIVPRVATSPPLGATLLWAGGMLMVMYLVFASLALHSLSADSVPQCFQALGREYLYPRFWVQGRLECMYSVAPEHWLFRSWKDMGPAP